MKSSAKINPISVLNRQKNRAMFLLLFLGLVSNHIGFGQTANTYSFSTSTGAGALNSASWTTNTATSANCDDGSFTGTLPFTFIYEGVSYTQFSYNFNGVFKFGASSIGAALSGLTSNGPIIAAGFNDVSSGFITGNTGYIRHGLTSAAAPNRVFVIDYYIRHNLDCSNGKSTSFQIRLYETTNVIEIVFLVKPGSSTWSTSTTSVGLGGANSLNFYSVQTSNNTASTSTVSIASTIPANGTMYTFTTPIITTTSTMTPFLTSSCSTSASASQSFTISGTNMQGAITVTAPTGFEVSLNNSTFSSSVTLGAAGTISQTTVWVRLAASANSPSSGNITCSSLNATSGSVAVNGANTTIAWNDGSSASAWYTSANWSPNVASSGWQTCHISQFNNTGTATTAGINMGTSSLSIGAIEVTSSRTRTLTIGNSSPTSGTLTLNGQIVNSSTNTILRNASNSLVTLQDNETGTGKVMNITLGNATDNKINIDGSGGITISSIISGSSRNLTKDGSGAGILTLSGANSYSGTTTISSGTLRATTNASSLGVGNLILQGGTLQLANSSGLNFGRNTTVSGNSTITSDVLTSGSGVTHTLGTLSIGSQTLTITGGSNVSSGTAGITFGSVTLTGSSTFGVTNPTAGTTQLSLGAVSNGGFTPTFNGNGNVIQTGVWSGSGGLTYSGTGSLTLNQSNTFSGTITINSGTLTLSATNTLPISSSAGLIQFAGGTPIFNLPLFNLGSGTSTSTSAGSLDFDVNTIVNLGSSGTMTYYFKASNSQTWNATTVTINNWTGTPGQTGTGPKIFIGSDATGLTQAQLDKITFTGYGAAIQLSSGEIVPTNNYYSKSTGNLQLLATWGSKTDGSGASPLNFTANGITYNIRNNASPTISANWTVSGTGSKVVVGDGTNTLQYTIPSGSTYSSVATDISQNSTLRNQNASVTSLGTATVLGTYEHNCPGGTVPQATWAATSTCRITGATNALPAGITNSGAQTNMFGNFEWNCPNQSGEINFASSGSTWSTFTLEGNLIVRNTGSSQLLIGGNATNVTRTFIVKGNFELSNSGTNSNFTLTEYWDDIALNVNGNVTISSGTLDLSSWSSSAGIGEINIGGNFIHTGGTITETGTSLDCIIRINGTGAQTIESTGRTNTIAFSINQTTATGTCSIASGKTFVNSGGTFIVTDNTSTSSDFTISGTFRRSGTPLVTFIGTTVDNGGIYDHNISTTLAIPTATWADGSLCSITGATGSDNLTNIGQSFWNFTFNSTGGALLINNSSFGVRNILSMPITNGGSITIASTANTTVNINTLNIAGGTFNGSTSTFTSGLTGTVNVSGGTYNGTSNTGGSTITGAVTVSGGTFNAITGSFASTQTISGGLIINGGTFNITTNTANVVHILDLNGNLDVSSGTFNLCNQTTSNAAGRLYLSGNLTVSGGTIARTQTATGGSTGLYFDGTTQTFTWSGGTLTGAVPNRFYINGVTTLNEVYSHGSSAQTTVNGTSGSPGVGSAWPTSGGVINNVTVNNSAGVTLSASKVVNGALTLSSGKLAIGANTLTLNGSVASISATNSLTGSSSSNLTIGGTGSLGTLFLDQTTNGTTNNLATLTLNRTSSGTVTLGNAVTVGTTLTLTSGIITTSATNTLTITNSASAAISGGSASSYINGPLNRSMVNGQNYFYPIGGNTSNYRPITLRSVVAATPVVRVTVSESGATTIDGSTLLSLLGGRNWRIEQISGSFTSATLEITETGMTNGTHEIAKSNNTQAGIYATCGSPQTVASGIITSPAGQTVGFYAIGSKQAAITSFISNTNSGNWGVASSWTLSSGTDEDGIPDNNDQASIINGNTIIVDNTHSCLTLTIGNATTGGTLSFNNTTQLTVGGDITFNSGGTSTIDMTSGGTLIFNNISGTTTSASLIAGTGTFRTNNSSSYTMPVNFRSFYNLIVASTSTSNVVTIPSGGNVTINNNLTLNTNARLTLSCSNMTVTGQTNLSGFLVSNLSNVSYTFNNNITVNPLGSYFTNNTGTSTINGNLILNGGAFADTAGSASNHTNIINGNLIVNAGTSNAFGCGTLTVNGTTSVNGSIRWIFSTAGTKTFKNDVTISSTGNWNNIINEGFTFEKNLTINGLITTGSAAIYTFNGTSTISGSSANPNVGGLTISSGASLTLDCQNPITIKGSFAGSGTATLAANRTAIFEGSAATFSGTLNFNNIGSKSIYSGTVGAQTIETGTYYELEINKSSGSAIIQTGNTNVTNNLTVTSGTLSLGSATGVRNLNISGNTLIASSGILSFNLSTPGSTGTKTFTGDITNNGNVSISGTSQAIFVVAGNISNNGTWTNTNSNSRISLSGTSKIINGNSITFNDCFINGTIINNIALTINDTLAGSGTLTQGTSATLNLASAFTTTNFDGSTNTNTVNYNGTGAQTIKADDYHHLTIGNRSATVTLGSGNMSINGTYTDNLSSGTYSVGSGTVDFTGTNCSIAGTGTNTAFNNLTVSGTLTAKNGTISIAGVFSNGGTFLPNNGTINFNGSSTQTIPALIFHNVTISNRAAAVTLEGSEIIYIGGTYTDNVTAGSYVVSGSTVEFTGTGSAISGSGTNTAFNNLTISSGATLTGKSSTVRIAGTLTNNGTYNHNNGTVSFNAATGNQTLSGSGTTNFYDVLVSHATSGGISISSGTYNLYHSLDVASNTNTLALGTNRLTLKSTGLSNDATARIGNLSTISTFSGSINLERFIGGNTAWRQLGTCMSNKTLADWYNSTNFPMSGFTGVPNVNGFVSAYLYNETLSAGNFDNGWVAATNITNSISPDNGTLNGRGYTIYVGQTASQTPMNNFTNTMSGSFIRGTQNITLTNQTPGGENSTSNTGFHVLANPYPSQIDLSLGSWNAAIKGYYNLVNGSYVWNNGMTGIIPQGNAIMIFTDANNVSMSFTEAMKTSGGGSTTFMKPVNPPTNALELHINSNINTFEDQCAIFFNENGNDGYVNESDDVRKLNSPDNRVPRIATLTKEGVRTVQNDYIDLKHSFYIPVEVHTPFAGSYSIYGKAYNTNGKCLVLLDKETGTEIDLSKDFNYTFQSNTKKTYENRFAIVNKSCGWNNSNNQNAIFRLNQNDENIELTLISDENVTGSLSVISINGQVVLNKSNCNLGNTEIINTQSLNKGIYIVKFVTDDAVYSEKVVID